MEILAGAARAGRIKTSLSPPMILGRFSIGLFLIFLASLPFWQARGQTPPPPPLGSRTTNSPDSDVPSSPSSTDNAADLSGIWAVESQGKCWYDRYPDGSIAGPATSKMCETSGMGPLILDDAQGTITGKFFSPLSPWLRPKPDEPYTKVNEDGSHNIDEASFDGRTLRLSLSFKLTPHPKEKETYSFVLVVDEENPNLLAGTLRIEQLYPDGSGAGNFELRFNREGAPIVRVRNPEPGGGSWVPWILAPGAGWVIYKLAEKGLRKKNGKEPKEYELDIRTEDDRTSLSPDGEDLLWVYAQVRCNKPEVDTESMTSALAFTPEGPDSQWLCLGSTQSSNGFKTLPVRAWPPSANAQLAEGKATVMVSAMIEGHPISSPVAIFLEESLRMEIS